MWDDGYYGGFRDYVSVAQRRQQAAREVAKLAKKGRTITPIVIDGRKITTTFWGDAWCENLERYSDFANRLPRGRTYVRNGSVVDLQVTPGTVTALVSGSRLYDVRVSVAAVPATQWKAICRDSAGAIDSVIELLQGRLSTAVMTRLCAPGSGLFPAPKDIQLSCSCPDWASMCKHIAAVLYGIGARLDHEPALLFTLRKVKESDLVAGAGTAARLTKGSRSTKAPASRKTLDDASLADVFGIEIAAKAPKAPAERRAKAPKAKPQPKPQPQPKPAASSAARKKTRAGGAR